MNSMERLDALTAALLLLKDAKVKVVNGPDCVWKKVYHASQYLDQQAKEVFEEVTQ